jgi:hypothetical protein
MLGKHKPAEKSDELPEAWNINAQRCKNKLIADIEHTITSQHSQEAQTDE